MFHLVPHHENIHKIFPPEKFFQKFAEKIDMTGVDVNNFDYMDTLEFVAISSDFYRETLDLITKINAIFVKAYDFYFENFDKNLTDFYDFKNFFRPNFPLNEQFIARYDILIEKNTGILKFLETNANTPWMVTESFFPSEMLTPAGHTNQSKNYINYIKKFWQEKKREKNLKKVGIFTAFSHQNEDYLTIETYRIILEEIFGENNVLTGDIYDVNIIKNTAVTMHGESIDAILSYFPLEFFLTDENFFKDFLEIISTKNIFFTNPLESIILQDKLIFAVIWENFEKFSDEEKILIKKHIPFTTREFQENSEKFLAKWRFGRFGREIFTENFYTNIYEDGKYIFQEKIETAEENGNFLVIGAYSDMKNGFSLIARKQPVRTSDDTWSVVTPVYVEMKN